MTLQGGITDLVHLKAELQWLDHQLMTKGERDETDWEDRAVLLELVAKQEEFLEELMSWEAVGIELCV